MLKVNTESYKHEIIKRSVAHIPTDTTNIQFTKLLLFYGVQMASIYDENIS